MFYQILIVLFPLIVGSVLTLLINYILQLTTVRTDNKKFIRQNVEEVYTAINRIKKHFDDFEQMLSNIQANKTKLDITSHEEYQEIQPDLERIRTLVSLYLPSLKNDFETYSNKLTYLRIYQSNYLDKVLGRYCPPARGTGDPFADYNTSKHAFLLYHEHLQTFLERMVK